MNSTKNLKVDWPATMSAEHRHLMLTAKSCSLVEISRTKSNKSVWPWAQERDQDDAPEANSNSMQPELLPQGDSSPMLSPNVQLWFETVLNHIRTGGSCNISHHAGRINCHLCTSTGRYLLLLHFVL